MGRWRRKICTQLSLYHQRPCKYLCVLCVQERIHKHTPAANVDHQGLRQLGGSLVSMTMSWLHLIRDICGNLTVRKLYCMTYVFGVFMHGLSQRVRKDWPHAYAACVHDRGDQII